MTKCSCKDTELTLETKGPQMIKKPWGSELLFALTSKYAGKVIFIKKGHRLSLQYHNTKDETLYVHEGNGLLENRRKRRPTVFESVHKGSMHKD